ncbi:MAG: hypothetical protein ABSH47_07415 [Bryobacteraceae bacterium]
MFRPATISAYGLISGALVLYAKWLYIHPGNPIIGFALSLMADVVPMAIAVVAIIMSYKSPKKEHHLRTTLTLIVCGFVGTGILSLARINSEASHKAEMDRLNVRLQYVADQNQKILSGAMSGKPASPLTPATQPTEVDRRKNVLALLYNEYVLSHNNLSPSLLAGTEQPPAQWINERLKQLGESWAVMENQRHQEPTAEEIASALDKRITERNTPEPTPQDKWSNSDLKLRAQSLCMQIRSMAEAFDREQRSLTDKEMAESRLDPLDPKDHSPENQKAMTDRFYRHVHESEDLSNSQKGRFVFLRMQAVLIRDQLLKRLKRNRNDNNTRRVNDFIDSGFMVGSMFLIEIADYLDRMANELPD